MAGRVLVCYFGQARSTKAAVESQRRHVIQPLNADVLLCMSKIEHGDPIMGLGSCRIDVMDDSDLDMEVVLDDASARVGVPKDGWRMAERAIGDNWLGGLHGRRGAGMFIMHNKRRLLETLHRLELTDKYDWFVITRSDLLWLADHPNPCRAHWESSNVYVPTGEDYGGLNDRHIVCSAQNLETCLDLLSSLVKNATDIAKDHNALNFERFYKLCLDRQNVGICRFLAVAFLTGDAHTPTRWQRTLYDAKSKLWYKYKTEMDLAIKNASMQ